MAAGIARQLGQRQLFMNNQLYESSREVTLINIHSDMAAFWVTEPDARATDQELQELEKSIDTKLPENYKEFQKSVGYKRFRFKNPKYKQNSKIDSVAARIFARYDVDGRVVEFAITVRFFYPIKSVLENQLEYTTPYAYLENVGPRIPPHMLTVGAGMGQTNGQILMDLSEKHYGSIWYWERMDRTWGDRRNRKIGFLGNDIVDVFNRLEPYVD